MASPIFIKMKESLAVKLYYYIFVIEAVLLGGYFGYYITELPDNFFIPNSLISGIIVGLVVCIFLIVLLPYTSRILLPAEFINGNPKGLALIIFLGIVLLILGPLLYIYGERKDDPLLAIVAIVLGVQMIILSLIRLREVKKKQ